MAALIVRIKASHLPGLWTLSSKYLFAGSQLQASQKRYFAALGYRPLNGGTNLFAINRLNINCNPQFSSKPFKSQLKEVMDKKLIPEFLKHTKNIGDVIKSVDRNQWKRFFKIAGPISLVLLTLSYLRGESREKLVTEVEADKLMIKQKLQEDEREQKHKRPDTSHVTPFSKVLRKNDTMEKDYALPSYTSAPKKRKDFIDSSLYTTESYKDMQGPDEGTLLPSDSKLLSPQSQVKQKLENVVSGTDDQGPCFESSPCKDVHKSEDMASKSNDLIPCSISPPCKDFKKPERSKSNSLIACIKSPPYKGVQNHETVESKSRSPFIKSTTRKDNLEVLSSKSNYQSPSVKLPPCKDKSEESALKSNSQNPCVRSPSSMNIQKSDELVPKDNSHNLYIKSPTATDFQKSEEMASAKIEPTPCNKTPPRIDLHKAKEWSLTKCSHIKTPPCANLVNSEGLNESHDTCNINPPCIVQKENNESSVNEPELMDVTGKISTLACTETKQIDNFKGSAKTKRLIRFSSPEKPVKENHNKAPGAKTPKSQFKKMQSEVVNDRANIKNTKSPQNIMKVVTEPCADLVAENISQNNATSLDGLNNSAIVQKASMGGQESVCTINPEEIEMDLSTTNRNNPEKGLKKSLVVNKSPIGNFMKKDCAKPDKPEKKVFLKSNFKEKGLEKDSTNYKRREVIEVNDNVCVDDK